MRVDNFIFEAISVRVDNLAFEVNFVRVNDGSVLLLGTSVGFGCCLGLGRRRVEISVSVPLFTDFNCAEILVGDLLP